MLPVETGESERSPFKNYDELGRLGLVIKLKENEDLADEILKFTRENRDKKVIPNHGLRESINSLKEKIEERLKKRRKIETGGFKMPDNAKETLEALETLKEVLKYPYDYIKHMTILSSGSILIIIAILEGVFKEPKDIGIVMASIVSFVLSLICSLILMSIIANLVLYITSIYGFYVAGNVGGIKEALDKVNSICKKAKVIEWFNNIFFFLGIAMLVCFAFINFL